MLKSVFPINGHLHSATNYQILLNKLVFSLFFFLSLVGKQSFANIFQTLERKFPRIYAAQLVFEMLKLRLLAGFG